MMKTFNISWYEEETCPLGVKIERTINLCTSKETHIQNLLSFLDKERLHKFMIACILYWSESERYDERNRHAVLASKKIAEHFPSLKDTDIDDDILLNAYGFTQGAHRYLQQTMFDVTLLFLETEQKSEIAQWYNDQQFVIVDNNTIIPYEEYKVKRSLGEF